jgi:hypothetical protein
MADDSASLNRMRLSSLRVELQRRLSPERPRISRISTETAGSAPFRRRYLFASSKPLMVVGEEEAALE